MVGILVGMTGVGGGSLMTPLLVLMFGFHPATAVGTDLLYASVTKSVGTAIHHPKKTVDWRVVGLLASGSVPASIVTLYVMSQVGTLEQGAVGILSLLLGIMLLLTGIAILFQRRIVMSLRHETETVSSSSVAKLTVVLGVALGILVSLTSVGAGALGTTALLILYPRFPVARIAGSDIAHAVPLTLIAGIGHWMYGAVDFELMGSLLVGSIPGIIIGSLVATKVSDNVLRPVLALTLLAVGAKLVFF